MWGSVGWALDGVEVKIFKQELNEDGGQLFVVHPIINRRKPDICRKATFVQIITVLCHQ